MKKQSNFGLLLLLICVVLIVTNREFLTVFDILSTKNNTVDTADSSIKSFSNGGSYGGGFGRQK